MLAVVALGGGGGGGGGGRGGGGGGGGGGVCVCVCVCLKREEKKLNKKQWSKLKEKEFLKRSSGVKVFDGLHCS